MTAENHLTPQEVSCLKTSLALVILKQRLKAHQEETKLSLESSNRLCKAPRLAPEWLDGSMKSMSAPCISFIPASTNIDDVCRHLDHVMSLATQSVCRLKDCQSAPESRTIQSQLESLTTHLSSQIITNNNADTIDTRSVDVEAGNTESPGSVRAWVLGSLKEHPADPWYAVLSSNGSKICEILIPLLVQLIVDYLAADSKQDPSCWYSSDTPVHWYSLLEECLTGVDSCEMVDWSLQELGPFSSSCSVWDLQVFPDLEKLLLRASLNLLMQKLTHGPNRISPTPSANGDTTSTSRM